MGIFQAETCKLGAKGEPGESSGQRGENGKWEDLLVADREKKVWLHSSTTGEGEEVEKHQERRRLPRLAGTGLCRAYKACQGISTFPRRIRAVGEEFKAGQGWLSPVLGEPPGPWEERERTEGVSGRWGCLCGAGIVWSR